MSDLHQRVRDDLHRVASDLDVPPPHLDTLVAAGRRRLRHRRLALVATLAAAVVAIIGGIGVGTSMFTSSAPVEPLRQGQTPRPVPPTPQHNALRVGAAPEVPYWHAGTLYTPQGTVRTAASDVYAAGDTVLVGQRHAPDGTYTWWQVTHGTTHRAPIPASVVSPYLSSDGRLVVWEEVHPSVTRVVAWDPATGRVLAWKDVQVQQGCCGGPALMLFGVDNAGQAFYGTGRALVVWDTRTNTAYTVTGLGDLPPQPDVTATGIVLQGQGGSFNDAPGVYGTVDERGGFHRTGTVPWELGSWSPDATLMEYPADDTGQFVLKATQTTEWVLDPASGKTTRIRYPRGNAGYVGWESNDAMLIQLRSGPYAHDVLRCQATTGDCEIALRGTTNRWRFPNP